jgi:carbon-monoxide dehydrogenase small subunit
MDCATYPLRLTVNGRSHELRVPPTRSLVEVLREDLNLTGTKVNCRLGECGVCTVLLDGRTVQSCLTLALHADGREVTTIEGLATNGTLHPIQQAFVAHQALQCGFCTPGMVLSAKALLDEEPHPTREQIQHGLTGNLCRCTGYEQIIEAVEAAASLIHPATEGGSQ